MWYVGPDVHLKSSSICVLDEHGRRINQKKILGPWPKLVAWLKDLPEPVSVCYEASCGYGPLYDALSQIVVRVEVAHPGHLRLIFRSKKKNDRVDAQKLARLLYLDEVPTVHAPSARPGRSAPMSLEFDESGLLRSNKHAPLRLAAQPVLCRGGALPGRAAALHDRIG